MTEVNRRLIGWIAIRRGRSIVDWIALAGSRNRVAVIFLAIILREGTLFDHASLHRNMEKLMARECEIDGDPCLLFKVVTLISHAIAKMLSNGKLLACQCSWRKQYRISDRLAIIDRTIKENAMVR